MFKLRRVVSAFVAVAAIAGAHQAQAQVFTMPFMSPQSESSVGVYLNDIDYADLTIEGIARSDFGNFTLGIRGGIIDAGDNTGITIGGELRSPLELDSDPIDLAVTAGIQGLLGDLDGLGVQAGLSLGHTFVPEEGNVRFTPYIHPRVAYIDWGGSSDGEVELLADVGFDVDFGTSLSLRFGASLAEGPDWGIGLAWRR